MKKITNIDHYISKCRNHPELISGNIAAIIHLAKLEALTSGYGEDLPESRIKNDYENGLKSLSYEIAD